MNIEEFNHSIGTSDDDSHDLASLWFQAADMGSELGLRITNVERMSAAPGRYRRRYVVYFEEDVPTLAEVTCTQGDAEHEAVTRHVESAEDREDGQQDWLLDCDHTMIVGRHDG